LEHFDLIVIGSGPAGRRAAIQAAKLGKSVLVVERRIRLGGVSVHTGTIPSKTLRETVLNLSGWRERGFYGLSYRVKKEIEGKDLGARLQKTLDYEIEVLEHQFARNGVRTFAGEARFKDDHHLVVADQNGDEHLFGFDFAVIAVGTSPFRPSNIPFDDHTILDSDSLVAEPRVPRSLTVIGAGVIGIEYATIFSALDVPVTLIEPRESYLDFIDREIIEEFSHDLRKRGMTIRLGAKVDRVEKDAQGWAITILTDGRQIHVRNIYAAGDVIGFPSLASTSMEQGRIAALHAFGASMPPAPEFFPYGIYAVPEISTVGLTEQQVRAQNIPYECGVARFRETSRGHIMGLQSGMMKMIVSLETRKLLGVHIVGEGATELIHIGQAVLNLGATLDYFVENTFNYPTLAEAYKIAALDAWNRMPRTKPIAEVMDEPEIELTRRKVAGKAGA
jgi:NAD(P) transhydrogenase